MNRGEKVKFIITPETHTVVNLDGKDHFFAEVEPARYWKINIDDIITTEETKEHFVEKFELVEYMKVSLNDRTEKYVRATQPETCYALTFDSDAETKHLFRSEGNVNSRRIHNQDMLPGFNTTTNRYFLWIDGRRTDELPAYKKERALLARSEIEASLDGHKKVMKFPLIVEGKRMMITISHET